VSNVVSYEDILPVVPGDRSGPRVAVLVSLNFPDLTDSVAELIRRFTRNALQELDNRGCDWALTDTSAALPTVDSVLDADALLILGGGDVDSEMYGVAGPAPHEYGVDRVADEFSVDVIRQAVGQGIPVLGICRGSQLLNVAFGGTLIPDIENFALHRGAHHDQLFVDEVISVEPGTRLHAVLGCDSLVVRTGHHQAVAEVASDLRVAAVAADGVVEGIEHAHSWALGVQWHPEDDHGPSDARHALFGAFVAQAELNRPVHS